MSINCPKIVQKFPKIDQHCPKLIKIERLPQQLHIFSTLCIVPSYHKTTPTHLRFFHHIEMSRHYCIQTMRKLVTRSLLLHKPPKVRSFFFCVVPLGFFLAHHSISMQDLFWQFQKCSKYKKL